MGQERTGLGSGDANFLPLRMNLEPAYLLKGSAAWRGQETGTGVEPDGLVGSKVRRDEVQGAPQGLFACW